MKEFHLFYAPQLPDGPLELPQEEASHAVRVLRMKEGFASLTKLTWDLRLNAPHPDAAEINL